ncbi:hypothetical protein C7451_12313 [Blastomonas natatoria]|uniref:Uncharacterized protein n=1 Tax=Blastomonas natatoria TaxID=34015 RepID=A0A2V3UNU0_9SPHN|nr:hypothetical protein [Blastomonas natatoria]PXW67877.1 hypothetical protein C7451_12313 [Blastomonas natatoria]
MRPDPTLWGLKADRRPQHGFFGEPISAAIAGVALMLAAIAIPGRFFLTLVLELIR